MLSAPGPRWATVIPTQPRLHRHSHKRMRVRVSSPKRHTYVRSLVSSNRGFSNLPRFMNAGSSLRSARHRSCWLCRVHPLLLPSISCPLPRHSSSRVPCETKAPLCSILFDFYPDCHGIETPWCFDLFGVSFFQRPFRWIFSRADDSDWHSWNICMCIYIYIYFLFSYLFFFFRYFFRYFHTRQARDKHS